VIVLYGVSLHKTHFWFDTWRYGEKIWTLKLCSLLLQSHFKTCTLFLFYLSFCFYKLNRISNLEKKLFCSLDKTRRQCQNLRLFWKFVYKCLFFTMYCSQICLKRKLKFYFRNISLEKTKRDAWLVLNIFCSIILLFSWCEISVLFNEKNPQKSLQISQKKIQ